MIAQNSIVQNKWAKSPYCKLLLHMNGDNDGTTFIDASPSPKTITANGGACTKTAVKRFGNASAYFDGDGDYLSVTNSSDFNFGTNDWTISLWYNPSSLTVNDTFLFKSHTDNDAYPVFLYDIGNTLGKIRFIVRDASNVNIGSYEVTSAISFEVGKSYHLVLERKGSSILLYLNGISIPLTEGVAIGSSSISTSTKDFLVGAHPYFASRDINGYIDELAIWNGVAIPISDLYPARAPLYDYAISEWSGQ